MRTPISLRRSNTCRTRNGSPMIERAVELASECRPAGVARVGLRIVDRDAGAPLLRGVPGDVRVADERLCILPAPADRAADAGLDRERDAVDLERRPQRLQHRAPE